LEFLKRNDSNSEFGIILILSFALIFIICGNLYLQQRALADGLTQENLPDLCDEDGSVKPEDAYCSKQN
jgi:hypothetical protein